MTCAFIFPGRGAESIGMGLHYVQAYPSARYVFQEIDDALGQELSRLIFEGPEDELAHPENADPAMLAVSLAGVKALEEQGDLPVAGLRDREDGGCTEFQIGRFDAMGCASVAVERRRSLGQSLDVVCHSYEL